MPMLSGPMSMPSGPRGQQQPGGAAYDGGTVPQPPAGSPAAGKPPAGRRGPSRGMLAVAVGVMLLAVAASGAVGFALTRVRGGAFVSCGASTCFGHVDQDRIESDLTERGFVCDTASVFRDCTYRAVRRTYRVGFETVHGDLSGVSVSVISTSGFSTSAEGTNLLIWVVGQVFVGDDVSRGKVEDWLHEHVSSHLDDELRLNGYLFRFSSVSESSLGLNISAVRR